MFPGFTEDTVRFLLDIRFHNNKTFMEAHRDEYKKIVQEPFFALIDELGPAMRKIDPEMEIRPAKVLSRIYRDTRFSQDKAPYRDHHWIAFRPAGTARYGQPFYWFEFGPDSLSWGAGIWGAERTVMNAFRLRLAHEGESFLQTVDSLKRQNIAVSGDSMPRLKIPENLPEALQPLYRLKSIYFERLGIRYDWAFDEKLTGRVST